MAALFEGLDAEAYDRQYGDLKLLKRIGRYFRPHVRKIVVVTVSVFIMAVTGAGLPLLVSRGVNIVTESGQTELFPLLVGIVFAVGVGYWLANWVRRRLMIEVIADVVLDMRTNAFDAAARQDLAFYDEFSSGRVVSRITSDTEEFGQVVTLAADVINQVFTALLLLVILFRIQMELTLAVLILAPIVAVVAISFRRMARQVTRQGTRVMGEVNKAIQEAVTGISVAKNFRKEEMIYDEFLGVNEQSYDINLRRGFVLAMIFPTLNAMSGLATAGLLYFGGRTAVAGVISVSAWYLFMATVDRFWFPMINVSAFWSRFQQGLAATERVFALIDAEPAVEQEASRPMTDLHGKITFEEVDFRYTEQEQVLEDFSLKIPAGQSIALVGHTGAGKTSIIKLIARFYEFQDGRLCIDGQDIRSFDLTAYREHLGIVSQVPFLFSDTIMENIRYGRPEARKSRRWPIASATVNGYRRCPTAYTVRWANGAAGSPWASGSSWP